LYDSIKKSSQINTKCKVPKFKCICCEDKNVAGSYNPSTKDLEICWNNSKKEPDIFIITIRHELTHSYQDCNNEIDLSSCEATLCNEIQAHFNQLPPHVPAEMVQTKVIEGAISSLKLMGERNPCKEDPDLNLTATNIYAKCATRLQK
jgi:hypothetical protein